jgi:hypothetical protein
MLGILIEKMRLLEEKPTQIYSHKEADHITDVLIPAMIEEAKRRGMVIEANPDYQVSITDGQLVDD